MDVPAAQLAAPQQWWQYGVLGVGVVAFAIVIVFLFKQYQKAVAAAEIERKLISDERTAWALERERWAIEREKIRGEYHAQHAALVVEYAKQISEERDECQKRQDAIRADYDELTEKRADEQKKAMDALVETLGKFRDKIEVQPQRGRH